MKIWHSCIRMTAMAIGLFFLVPNAAHAQVQSEGLGRYYEEDAWYDITEWFDGNDYHPTDEVIGRWNDETYTQQGGGNSYEEWPTSSYYDYDQNDSYEVQMLTADTDRDGYVDTYQAWADTDGDGVYDLTEHVVLADPASSQDSSVRSSSPPSTHPQSHRRIPSNDDVQGIVESVRHVNTKVGQRIVATIKDQENRSIAVDLGRPRQLSQKPQEGDQLAARGTLLQWNGKTILAATSAAIDGKQVQVERDTRHLSGTIKNVKEFRSAGKAHKMVMLDLGNNQSAAVDLGQVDKLKSQFQLQEGKKLQILGVPVKVKDRRLIVATMLQQDGNQQTIHRADTRS